MESKNSSLAILHEPFVAGMDENLSPIMQRLWKLEGGAIYFCRSGWAHVTIDLKDYEIVENTQIVLLPGTIIRINGNSSDFTASFFGFPKEMFREACLRFEPIFLLPIFVHIERLRLKNIVRPFYDRRHNAVYCAEHYGREKHYAQTDGKRTQQRINIYRFGSRQ